jgi:ADP-heptose:LPS heptosyltransferase
MKIFFMGSSGFDYLQDLSFYGLTQQLGFDNIYHYPWNAKYVLPFWRYPKNIGYSKGGHFRVPGLSGQIKFADAVIVGSSKKDTFQTLLTLIHEIPSATPLVLIDGGDRPSIAGDLEREDATDLFEQASAIRPFDLILKREMLLDQDYPNNILPYPFWFKHDVALFSSKHKRFDVAFWAVESNAVRSLALDTLKGQFDCDSNGTRKGQSLLAYSRKGTTYLSALAECKISLNYHGEGTDTLRFWESLGVGSFLLTQKPRIRMNQPFKNNEHVVFLEDDVSDLLEKCRYYLDHEKEREAIASSGRFHLLKYHSHAHRINFLLQSLGRVQSSIVVPVQSNAEIENTTSLQEVEGAVPTVSASRIGVLLYGLLGDVLIRTPFLRELRSLYPDSQIIAFVDPSGREALELTNLVDETVVVSRARRRFRSEIFLRFFNILKLRFFRFDLLIDLYVSQSSEIESFCSGATYRIRSGFENPTANFLVHSYDLLNPYRFINSHHYSNSSLRSLAFLTFSKVNLSTRPALDMSRLSALAITTRKISDSFFLISLGAGDPRKVPGTDEMAVLCKHIWKTKGYLPVIVRNPGQENLQSALRAALSSSNTPSYGLEASSLSEIAALMLNAKIVITPDSGLFHIAVGLGVELLAFFTYTNPELVRPESKNVTIFFNPTTAHDTSETFLPFGNRLPSIDNVLATVSSVLKRLDN